MSAARWRLTDKGFCRCIEAARRVTVVDVPCTSSASRRLPRRTTGTASPSDRPRPPASGSPLSPQAVMALQRSAGNAAVGRMLAREPAPAAAPPAAGSGVDWAHVWDEVMFFENGVPTSDSFRLIGEVGRVVPVFGAFTGAAADSIAAHQDVFGGTWKYEAPITRTLLAARGATNLLNNGLGHLNYVSQLTQDTVALFSGFTGTWFTAGINEGLAISKLIVDGFQSGLDATITTMALWNAIEAGPPAPGNLEEIDAWLALAVNYEANLVGDVIGMVVDGIDILTAGLGHGNTLEDIGLWLADMGVWGRNIFNLIVDELQGQLNLRGGGLLMGGLEEVVQPAVARASLGREVSGESLALDAAIFQLRQVQGAHQLGDQLLGQAGGAVGELAARANEVGTALLDGQEPFTFVREQAADVVGEVRTRIAVLGELAQGGTNAAATTDGVLANVAQMRAALEALEVPEELGLEAPDLGEGMLADAGEAVLGAGAELAGQGASAALAQIQSALDAAKEAAFEGLDAVAENADEIGRFMQLLAEQSQRQAVELETMLATFEEALSRTQNFEELFETLIEQMLAAAGIEADIDFDDLRAAWADAGGWIDGMLADLEARRAGETPSGTVDEAAIRNAPRMAGGQAEES